MATTMDQLVRAVKSNGGLTLDQVRDRVPSSINKDKMMRVIQWLDATQLTGFSREERLAIYLGGVMVSLLPD